MLSELHAIVSMQNRRNNIQLVEIAEIDRTIQRIDKFRMLVIQGFQAPAEEQHGSYNAPFLCRDAKNNMICISIDDLEQEVSRMENCWERLVALYSQRQQFRISPPKFSGPSFTRSNSSYKFVAITPVATSKRR